MKPCKPSRIDPPENPNWCCGTHRIIWEYDLSGVCPIQVATKAGLLEAVEVVRALTLNVEKTWSFEARVALDQALKLLAERANEVPIRG